jgi:hypothetical protein
MQTPPCTGLDLDTHHLSNLFHHHRQTDRHTHITETYLAERKEGLVCLLLVGDKRAGVCVKASMGGRRRRRRRRQQRERETKKNDDADDGTTRTADLDLLILSFLWCVCVCVCVVGHLCMGRGGKCECESVSV